MPRYRAVGSRTLRATATDFRHLDPHLPMQCTVRFEPCEVDLDVRVEDMATGMPLQRVHVALGPHVLGSARGVLAPLALPPGARDARWPVEAAFRGWVLCAPRTVDVAAAKVRGAPQMVTVLMRRCEVLVAAVDAFTREPLAHAAARLKPADGNDAAAPWELVHDDAPGEAGFVVDVAGPRRGAVCARRDDKYDVRCDDGGEERGCSAAELRRASGEHAAVYGLEDRVELRRRGQGDYTLEATCEGYRQASHCELLANDGVRPTPMTFAVQDFVRLPAREPLRLTVELEALYGHADVRVLDGAGRPLDDADVWIDRHYVGKRRGRVRLRLPGGGAPHGAKVACVCPGYVLIRPATVELRCGACVAVAVEMQRCAALVRVEDARDGAPVDARVCLVPLRSADSGHRAPPKWVQVGSKVEAVYPDSGGWYGAVVRGVHSDGTYDVDFDDGVRCDGVGPWHVREPGKEALSKPAPLKADHDFDETLDVQAQAWCDWRTMKPVGVDVQPARYRVVVHDASGDYRQVSHLAPVEIRGAELLSLDDALAAHRVPEKKASAAPAGLFGGLFGTSKKAKETAAASGARAAALLNELRARDARSRVAVLVVKVAPRCAKATIQVLDGSGLAPLPEASVKLGRVVLGTRRGNVEVDWAKIAPGDSLAPACPWQHAAGARVTGSGVPVAVDAALDGFVQISETTVPFTASGVTRVVVTMRRATVALKTVDSVTGAALGDVAVDLQPLDGQALVSWPLGHVYDGNDGARLAAPRVVVVGSRYRAVAQGSRLRQVSPDPAAVMTFGRHLWANGLPSDWDYELVVRLERRVTAVDVRVVDAGLNDAVLHDAKAVLGAGAGGASFSAAEGWTQDVEVAPGAKVLRDVAALAALEGYLQLPPRTLDIVVGDGGAPRVLRMRSLDVVVRPVSTYDRKALDDAEWRLVVEMADEDVDGEARARVAAVPRSARDRQRVRLGERYVADVGCPGWRLTTSAARLVFDVDERVGEFEAHAPGDAVPFEVPMEATTALVRLASVSVANGVAGDVRDSKLSAAETPVPLLDVVAVPLPRLLHAADKVDLDITAFVPDPSLDFVSPRTVTVNPGARAADGSWPAVTDVDAVFKRFHLIVTILDEKRNELRDATWTLDGESLVAWRKVAEGHRTQPIGSGGKHHVHLDTRYRLRVSASGRSQVDFREPVEFVDGDFTKSATKDGGWECRRQIVCVPCCATVELNVLDATTRESLPQAAVEFYGARSKTKLPYLLWNSEGTAPDDAGVRTIKLDNVPGGGDEVQLAVSATLPGYTHIDPKLFELRATRADAAVVQLELLMRKYYVVADVVDPRGDELRVRGAGVELRPATLADATDDVAKRQRAAAVVTFKPADVTGQSPVPVVLGVVYDVVATHLEPPRAVQREHLFRGAWRPRPETICFREEDFHELERKASEATRKMKKNAVSDDLRYPFLKRIVERPTWRALHSWTLAARAKRRPDLRAPPYALKVRAMATHCAVDVAVLDPEGTALTKAAVRYRARGADAWSALGAPRLANLTIPNGGLPTVMAFEATLPGYLSESPTTEKTLFATYRAAQPQNAAVERVELVLRRVDVAIRVTDGDGAALTRARVTLAPDDARVPAPADAAAAPAAAPVDPPPAAIADSDDEDAAADAELEIDGDGLYGRGRRRRRRYRLAASSPGLQPRTSLVAITDAGVRQHWAARGVDAPLVFTIALARAVAHVGVSVRDLAGALLTDAALEVAGQKLRAGDHSVPTAPLVELDAGDAFERALSSCFLEGYFACSPKLPGVLAASARDHGVDTPLRLEVIMQETLVVVQLVERRRNVPIAAPLGCKFVATLTPVEEPPAELEDSDPPQEFEDVRYPFLKRIVERPAWRGLHSWAAAAGALRAPNTEAFATLYAELKARRRAERLALTRRHYPVVVAQVDEPASVVCGVRYVVAVDVVAEDGYAPPALRQVTHDSVDAAALFTEQQWLDRVPKDGCDFRVDPVPLVVKMERDANLILDARDADSDAPLPDCSVELGGVVFGTQRGMLDLDDDIETLMVGDEDHLDDALTTRTPTRRGPPAATRRVELRGELRGFVQVSPPAVDIDGRRRTSLVVLMRRALVVVDVRDGGGDESLFERLFASESSAKCVVALTRTDDAHREPLRPVRPPGDGEAPVFAVEPGAAYDLEVYSKDRVAHRRALRLDGGLFLASPEPHALVVRLLRSTVRVDLSVVDAVTKAPLAGRAAVGKTDVGEARGEVDVALPPTDAGVVRLPLRCELDGYVLRAPRFVDCARGAVARCALELRSADVAVRVVLAGPRHGGPDNADDCAVALAPRRSGQAVATFGCGPPRPVARVVEGAAYAWALTGDSGDAYALVREDAEARPRFQASDWDALERDEPLEVVVRVARKAGEAAAAAVDADAPAAAVVLEVVDGDGAPVDAAEIYVGAVKLGTTRGACAVPVADGFEGGGFAVANVAARCPGYALIGPKVARLQPERKGPTTLRVVLRAARVVLRVVDGSLDGDAARRREPLPGARPEVRGLGSYDAALSAVDGEGRCILDPDAAYRLSVRWDALGRGPGARYRVRRATLSDDGAADPAMAGRTRLEWAAGFGDDGAVLAPGHLELWLARGRAARAAGAPHELHTPYGAERALLPLLLAREDDDASLDLPQRFRAWASDGDVSDGVFAEGVRHVHASLADLPVDELAGVAKALRRAVGRAPRDAPAAAAANGVVVAVPAGAFERPGDVRVDVEVEPVTCELLLEACEEATRVEIPLHACHVVAAWELRGETSAATETLERARGIFQVAAPGGGAAATLVLRLDVPGYAPWEARVAGRAGRRASVVAALRDVAAAAEPAAAPADALALTKKAEPTTLVDVWDASSRALLAAGAADARDVAAVVAELPKYVLVSPLTFPLKWSGDVRRVALHMRKATVVATAYDARGRGRAAPFARVSLRRDDDDDGAADAVVAAAAGHVEADVSLGAAYSLTAAADGWAQVTYEKRARFAPRHFRRQDLDRRAPLPLRVDLEPTVVDVNLVVVDAATEEDLDEALVSVHGIDVGENRGIVTLDLAELRARGAGAWVAKDGALALPLRVRARLDGFLDVEEHRWVRAAAREPGKAAATCTVLLRRSEVAALCVDAASGDPVKDLISVTLIPEFGWAEDAATAAAKAAGSVHFDRVSRADVLRWIAAEKDEAEAADLFDDEFAEPRPAINAAVVAREATLRALATPSCSAKELLKALGDLAPADVPGDELRRVVDEMSKHGARSVAVGARYAVRASHVDYVATDPKQFVRFEARGWRSIPPAQPRVVTIPVTPVFADVAITVVDDATSSEVEDAAVSLGDEFLGLKRKARLRSFFTTSIGPKDVAIALAHPRYVLLEPRTVRLAPGAGETAIACRARRATVALRPTRDGVPVDGAVCVLNDVDASLPRGAGVELGATYVVSATHDALLQIEARTLSFDEHDFRGVVDASQPLIVDVPMEERGSYFTVTCVDEVSGDDVPECEVRVGDHALGVARGPVNEVAVRRPGHKGPIRVVAVAPAYVLASAAVIATPRGARGAADAAVDEFDAEVAPPCNDVQDDCLTCVYAALKPSAGADTVLELRLRPMRVVVGVTHASEPAADLSSTHIAVVARDGLRRPPANLVIERIDVEELRETPQKPPLPTAASSRSVASLATGNVTFDGMHKQQKWAWLVSGFPPSRDGYYVVARHAAARARDVAAFGLEDVLKRPRFDALKCDVLLEPVDGGVDLDVCDVDVEDQGALAKLPAADVALGHHRVGAWRGRVQLIEIAGGGRPRHLDVSSRLARFVLVGFGPLSAGFAGSRAAPPLRAAHEAAVDVGMRRAMASFVARNRSDGAKLTGYTTTLRVYGGDDAETVVARDGEAVAVVAGAPRAGAVAAVLDGAALVRLDDAPGEDRRVPLRLLARRRGSFGDVPAELLPGDRVDAPERVYVVECHKEGYRQVSHRVEGTLEPFALPASLFAGNRSGGPVMIDVFVEKAAAELLFDVVDSDGAALEGAALEVDGVALADGAKSCGVPIGAAGVSDVQVAASLAGYAQLAPAGPVRVDAAAVGPTKVAVVLERYVLHVGVLAADGAPANGALVTARFDGAGTVLGAGPRRRPYVLPSRRGAYVVEAALEGSKQVDHLDPVAFESLTWFASPAAALADLAQASGDAAAFARRERSRAPRERVARRLFFRQQGLAFYKWRLETTCLDADWDAAAPRGKHAFLVVRVAATASAVSVDVVDVDDGSAVPGAVVTLNGASFGTQRGAVDAAAAGFARDAAGRLPSAEARFDGYHSADLLERRAGRATALTFKLRAHPVVCRVFEPARGAHAGGAVALLEGADASGARLSGYLRFDAEGAAAGAVGRRGDAAVLPLAGRVVKGELELSAARTVDARAVLRATLGAAGDRGVDVAGAFGSWDADWDGKLTRGELCHAFASLRIALNAAEVAAILALVEDDGQKSDVCALLRGGGVDASLFVGARLEHALRRLDLERGVLVEAVFAEWDANGNGLLSRKELKAGLATMGLFEGVDDVDVDAVFERTRATRADGVSLPDFIAFLGWSPAAVLARRLRGVLLKAEQLGTSLDAAFAAWDEDGDGRVSPAELAAGLKGLRSFGNLLSGDGAASERVVFELVKLFDVDGDGAISVRELYRFLGRDATVVTEQRLRRVIHGSGIGAEEAFRHFAGAADEVSSADLAAGVRSLPNFEDVTEDDAAKLAAFYDATGDGTTSLNEFVRQVGATADVGEAEATLLLKLRGAVNEPAAPGERPRGFRAFKLACRARASGGALDADALGRVFRDLGVEDAPAAMLRLLVARLSTKPTVAVDDVLAFARRGGVGAPPDVAARLGEPSPHGGALRAHPDAAADKFGRLLASYEAAGLDAGAFFASLDANGNDAISPGELYAGLKRHDAFADMTRQDALRVRRHVDSSRNGAIEVGELEAFARDHKARGERAADVAAGPWTEAFGAARAAAALAAFADDGGALASLFPGAAALGAAALLDACRATEWPDLKVLERRDLEAIVAQAGSDDSLDARELLAFLGTWRAYRATFAGSGSDTAETYATRSGFVLRKTAVADVRGTSAAGASDRWDLDVAWPEAADVRALRDAATPEALELLVRGAETAGAAPAQRPFDDVTHAIAVHLHPHVAARRQVDFPAGGDARELVSTGDPGYAVRLGDGGDRRCVRKWRLGAVGAFKGTAWTDASTPVTFSDAAFDAMREAAREKQEEEIHDPRYRFCARAARHRLWRGLLTWTRVAGAAPPPRADPLLAIPLEIRVGATSAVAKLDVVDDEGRRLPEARVTVDGADKGLARGSLAIETEEDASGDVAVDFGAVLEGHVQLPPTRVVLEGGRETRVSLRMRRCDVHFSVVDEATGDALPAAELEIQSDGRADALRGAGVVTVRPDRGYRVAAKLPGWRQVDADVVAWPAAAFLEERGRVACVVRLAHASVPLVVDVVDAGDDHAPLARARVNLGGHAFGAVAPGATLELPWACASAQTAVAVDVGGDDTWLLLGPLSLDLRDVPAEPRRITIRVRRAAVVVDVVEDRAGAPAQRLVHAAVTLVPVDGSSACRRATGPSGDALAVVPGSYDAAAAAPAMVQVGELRADLGADRFRALADARQPLTLTLRLAVSSVDVAARVVDGAGGPLESAALALNGVDYGHGRSVAVELPRLAPGEPTPARLDVDAEAALAGYVQAPESRRQRVSRLLPSNDVLAPRPPVVVHVLMRATRVVVRCVDARTREPLPRATWRLVAADGAADVGGPDAGVAVRLGVTYEIAASLRAWRPTSATTPPGVSDPERARPGAFAVRFSGSDFDGDEPGPLVVEVAFEPVALRVAVVLVEETPTDAATFLDDVAVSLGGTAATRDRALTLPLEALAAAGGTLRLPVAALGSRHVLVGPSELVHDLEGAGVDGDHEATLELTMRAASVEADALEAKDDGVALAKVDGATVAVAPYDAGYAGGTLLLDAGRPVPAVVELGRAYRVSARCDRMRLVSGDRFEIKPADVLALPPGGVSTISVVLARMLRATATLCVRALYDVARDREKPLQSAARAYDGAAFLAVDAAGRHGELDAAHEDPVRDDPPSKYAAVTIRAASNEGRGEGQGMGVARGTVEISVPPSGAVEARAALRGWAQLPPYKFVARPDASEPAHVALVMVPALVVLRAVDGATGKPLQDQAAVEAWLEPADDDDTAVRLPCCAAHGPPARVRPGARYVLKVKAPKRRLASPALVGGVLGGGAHGDELVFEDEHWWDASTKLRTAYGERPFSSREPVVLELVAALEPSRSTLRISVVADDAPSALGAGVRVRRRGLPDLRCRPGDVSVDGLPARQVEALVDGLLPGHVQLRPRDAVTLIAGGTQDVVVQLRPASVVARCVDARSHAPLDLGRVRLAPREPSAAGLEHARGRPPVVVDVAAWRPCVVTSHVADGAAPDDPALHAVAARFNGKLVAPVYAYGVTFDDGTRDVVPAAALRGARWGVLDSRADGDAKLDWGVLAARPAEASYAVGDRVEAPRGAAQAYVAGVVASALDGGRYGIDFDGESRTDVVAGAALRPERWTATFRCYLPVGLACEARHATRGLYDVAADLPGYRQVSHLEPVLFEAKKFVALGGPREKLATPNLAPPPLQLCQTTTVGLATTPLALLRRFNDLRTARALRTWAGGAARTRAARLLAPASLEGRGGASPPLEMTVKLVPCVGDLDVSVVDDATGLDLDDASIALHPPAGDAPPHVGDWPPMAQQPLNLGARRGRVRRVALAGDGEPTPMLVSAALETYFRCSPDRVWLRAGDRTAVAVRLRRALVRLRLVDFDTGAPWAPRAPDGAPRAELRRADTGRVVAVFSAAQNPVAVPLDVPLVFVVDAKRHAQKTMVDAVVYAADDFSRGPLDVAVALAPSSCAVDVRVVDAASGADLPLADFVCGDEHFGTRRGVLELAGPDLTAPRRVDALLDGYDDVDASRGRVLPVPGGVAPVVVRLRVFRVRLSAVRFRARGAPAALLDARVVLERVDGGACAPALSRDGVAEAGVSLGVAYRVRCTKDGFRQRSLRDPVTFDVAHFDGCGAAALALVVELEAETFEAMVRVVDDASDALIPGAVVTIGGHEFAAAPGPRGYRHVGQRVPGTPGPSAFPHAVATCPGYLQTSPRRLGLRNDGLAPCSTLRLRRAAVAVRVVDGDERAVPDPIVQLSLSARKRRPAAARRAARRAAVAVADAADAVRPRRSVLVVLGRSYDLRVVHESMRQRDLLDPQRFERLDFLRTGPLARAPGAPAAAPPPDPLTLTVHLEPYRCSIDLAVVDAFGDDLPDAQVKLGCYLVGTRRGVVDLDLTDRAVVGA